MSKLKNLSPKFKIPSAEKELEVFLSQESIPNRVGGLSLFSDSFKRGHGEAVFGSDSNGIWLGAADFDNAPFRVDMDGNLTATSATITGMGQNFVSTLTWTATDINTATWSAGTIKTSDGTSYSIVGGNTGDIVATTYVYLDPNTSTTALQTSTTATDAAGNGKILIAIVQIGSVGSECTIDAVGSSGTVIDGGRITTGTIVADKLNVSQLSAVSADLGTITAGDISGITIAIGSGDSIFKADSNGIYLGNATFASAPFRCDMSGNVYLNSYFLNDGDIGATGSGMAFKNAKGVYFYNSTNSALIGSISVDAANELQIFNTTGTTVISAGNVEGFSMATSGWVTMGYGASISGLNIPTGDLTMNTGSLTSSTSNINIASGKNLVFLGTQGSINCGTINSDSIEMNGSILSGCNTVSSTGSDINLNPASGYKVKFGNNIDLNEKNLDAGNDLWAYNFYKRSDKRLKKFIVDNDDGIAKLRQLRTVKYFLKKEKSVGKKSAGLLAQDVKAIFPKAVSADSDGYLAIKYNEIIPVLIKSIQDLDAEVTSLKKMINTKTKKLISNNI